MRDWDDAGGQAEAVEAILFAMDVAVLGAGSWGTALSILLGRNGLDVTLFARSHEEVSVMKHARENLRYLPGFTFPKEVTPDDISHCVGAPMTIVAVPSSAVRDVLGSLQGDHPLIVLATKGLESGSGKMATEIAKEVFPESKIAAISGPNLAIEIVRGVPTAAVAACEDATGADRVRSALMCPTYRVYASDDVVGVELAGALKNVLAIGGGLSDGLGFGDNTKGALMARGLKEMIQFGIARGGRLETFIGIAGVGDLIATAGSKLSRNYRVGFALGQGKHIGEALAEIGQVAEGIGTAEAATQIARQHGIQTPIFEMIDNVLRERIAPKAAVSLLMERFTREEGLSVDELMGKEEK